MQTPIIVSKDDNIAHFMDFITSPNLMTDSHIGKSSFMHTSGKVIKAPKIILNSAKSMTVDVYLIKCEATEYQNMLMKDHICAF